MALFQLCQRFLNCRAAVFPSDVTCEDDCIDLPQQRYLQEKEILRVEDISTFSIINGSFSWKGFDLLIVSFIRRDRRSMMMSGAKGVINVLFLEKMWEQVHVSMFHSLFFKGHMMLPLLDKTDNTQHVVTTFNCTTRICLWKLISLAHLEFVILFYQRNC